jgi:hypothetical protein
MGLTGSMLRVWVACAVLLVGAVWLMLAASGIMEIWAKGLSGRLPPLVIFAGVFAVPVLAALCSLHLQIDWRVRIAFFLLLLACVSFLPAAVDSHPVVVASVIAIFMVEEFLVIPLVNKRWIGRT